jgi:hypothetical protein
MDGILEGIIDNSHLKRVGIDINSPRRLISIIRKGISSGSGCHGRSIEWLLSGSGYVLDFWFVLDSENIF